MNIYKSSDCVSILVYCLCAFFPMMTISTIDLGQGLELVTSFACSFVENSLATPVFLIWSDFICDDYGGLYCHDEMK